MPTVKKVAQILGHRDLPGIRKDCPCYDIRADLIAGKSSPGGVKPAPNLRQDIPAGVKPAPNLRQEIPTGVWSEPNLRHIIPHRGKKQ